MFLISFNKFNKNYNIVQKQYLDDVLNCKGMMAAWIMRSRSVYVIEGRDINLISETFSDTTSVYPIAVDTAIGINVLMRI